MKHLSEFLSENVQFLVVKISIYLNRRVFVTMSLYIYGHSVAQPVVFLSSDSQCLRCLLRALIFVSPQLLVVL